MGVGLIRLRIHVENSGWPFLEEITAQRVSYD